MKVKTDQGWSWMIAFSTFTIVLIMSGLARMSAIFYVELLQIYNITREEAILPFSVRHLIRNLVGPIVGVLGSRFGVRNVTVVGAVVASVGAGLCFWAPNVLWITFFFGGVHGVGFGLANTLHYGVVNQYFVKYRAIAIGFSISGGCFGSFILPAVLEFCIQTYGLRGTFLVTAAIVMNVIPAGLLLFPAPWVEKNNNTRKKKQTSLRYDISKDSCNSNVKPGIEETRTSVPELFSKTRSDDNLSKTNRNKTPTDSTRPTTPNIEVQEITLPFLPQSDGRVNLEDSAVNSVSYTEDICTGSNVKIRKNRNWKGLEKCLNSLKLMGNVMFLHISISLAVYNLVHIIFSTIMLDYSYDKGLHRDFGKYIIAAFAVADLFGRLCLSWTIDRHIVTVKTYTIISLTSMGALFMMIPIANSLETFLVISVFFGIAAGATVVTYPLHVGHYLSAEEQSQGLGSACLFTGIISFAIPQIIGHFRDEMGSYDDMFYAIGGVAVLYGLTWLAEPFLIRIQRKNQLSTPVNS